MDEKWRNHEGAPIPLYKRPDLGYIGYLYWSDR
jgi:hypothetical protein